MTALAKIHVLKSKARLDDDTYRDILERETGKRSSKGMSEVEQLKVISALEAIAPRQVSQTVAGTFAKKLQALWIAGYNLGVVNERSDKAMVAFLRRQTGLDHHRFLQDPADANKALDALKLWIRRETGNPDLFTRDHNQPALHNDHRFQVCRHIWSELVKRDRTPVSTLTAYLLERSGHTDVSQQTSADWISAMNALGTLLRTCKR
ncbi:Mu-like prophage protein gp16 [Stappia aggregata IAM 12614]|uniref:Mu-like prophage protein gp16 n=1 Tax=Roseibium aggregatum (strain ATCC 25650 / DSM 13394 / JCM 20685 / NBRC 16684 / NCIMB 2208 / IAM 12614 / B1) TaxID=384765 RepID=A0P3I4_ROSAI|nr:regulatory protein GemA [Roseibium aggregatum]EAV40432.1 Mu-like prophage protein gp16 [Stappia aggregata IAM 12614] [Roseibium aggregatum IAM 12614]